MALPAAVVSMITVTNTAASIIGVIKRRCGASQAIVELTSKCDEIVVKIRKLLQTLEGDAEVPHDSRGISTALNLRREEFDAVLKVLEKMNRRTKRTHPADRTEKFILAQDWAKKMEAIYNDLVHVRNGIETIVSSWDVGQFVVTKVVEEIVTIDVTKEYEPGRGVRRRGVHAGCEANGHETVNYVDQYLTTMVTLTDRNKAALNRYGDLDKLSLPDALFNAWDLCCGWREKAVYLQLLQRSADLLHPEANRWMGSFRLEGDCGLEEDVNLAMSHFRVAISRGDVWSIVHMTHHYQRKNDRKSVLKYMKIAGETPMTLFEWTFCMWFAIRNGYEGIKLMPPLKTLDHYESAFQQSMCHFFGLGVPKSNENALDVSPTFDSDFTSIFVDPTDGNSLLVPEVAQYSLLGLNPKFALRKYADFLYESNQFRAWLLLSTSSWLYSKRRWTRYALHAASIHCIDANILLAHHYSFEPHLNQHEMKRHLRIAAGAGHSYAQDVCRQLFGRESNVSKGVRLVEEKRTGKQGKEKRLHRPKNSEVNKEAAPKKRNP